ncbi:MAG: nodulation protein NfeD [Proteobacteria bacterium]|nr:nodulation protein NfeD [Pseudomonadota bacterium]MBI3498115.1 nodulation protein NfeD [Pseudomonadota bacterium]
MPSRLGALAALVTALLTLSGAVFAGDRPVHVLTVRGAIGVATALYIERGIRQAEAEDSALAVIALDTPGGLVTSTRAIIQTILEAKVPVAVYVSPAGAQAASAGTYILYASHVAAMAPGSNMGAATPVSLGMPGLPGSTEPEKKSDPSDPNASKDKPAASGSTMERKILNDATAYMRSLAQLRHRNADWAEKAVREAATLTAEEAKKEQVIEVIARDLDDLLTQIDGRKVTVGNREVTLSTKGASIKSLDADWREKLIQVLTDPNIAYILMLGGIYGIIFEFWSPGFVLPGIIGGICLLLGLTALAVLPVNYGGLALMLLGIALMVAEAFTPNVMALGIGGLVSFVAGSIFLYDSAGNGFAVHVSWPLILGAAAASLVFFLTVLGIAMRARRRRVVSGREEMIGSRGTVVAWEGGEGRVKTHGEVWRARGAATLDPGTDIRVVGIDGLTLVVEPAASA